MFQILEASCEAISQIGNWYFLKNFTYIGLAKIMSAPIMFPKDIPDKIMLKESAFQILEIGQTIILTKRKLKAELEMPIFVGPFQLLNHGNAHK